MNFYKFCSHEKYQMSKQKNRNNQGENTSFKLPIAKTCFKSSTNEISTSSLKTRNENSSKKRDRKISEERKDLDMTICSFNRESKAGHISNWLLPSFLWLKWEK